MENDKALDWIGRLSAQQNEPDWMREARSAGWERFQSLNWPDSSDEIWRRTDYKKIAPNGYRFAAEQKLEGVPREVQDRYTQPLGDERLFVRINGDWTLLQPPEGVKILSLQDAAKNHAEWLQQAADTRSLTDTEIKMACLNEAFHHDGVFVHIPANFVDTVPWRFVHVWQAQDGCVSYPRKVIRVESGAEVTIIDEYVGIDDAAEHLIHARLELDLQPNARVHYVRLQRWGRNSKEFLLQRATLKRDASLTMANLSLGAALSKAHVVTRLLEPNAESRLFGFVFGRGEQHIDQHTLQDHQAPHTYSNLQYKAALQDKSHMVYTGLIRIAAEARQSEAYQENHNLLLDGTAKADTIPMLEILADDVQCKHAAAAGPIDEEQVFYLMSRGIPRTTAERIVVMGFVEPVISQVRFDPLQERLRQEIEGELHLEIKEGTGGDS